MTVIEDTATAAAEAARRLPCARALTLMALHVSTTVTPVAFSSHSDRTPSPPRLARTSSRLRSDVSATAAKNVTHVAPTGLVSASAL